MEEVELPICPNLEYAFQILGKKWNGFILHFLLNEPGNRSSFNELKHGVTNITAKALSACLQDLIEYGLVEKLVTATPQVVISYELTTQGMALVEALRPVQQWAYDFKTEEEV